MRRPFLALAPLTGCGLALGGCVVADGPAYRGTYAYGYGNYGPPPGGYYAPRYYRGGYYAPRYYGGGYHGRPYWR